MRSTVNNSTVKKTNRGQVFKQLVMNSGISRSDLTQSMNLTKMTISNIVSELLEKDLIVEQEKIIMGEPHKNPISLNLSEDCPRIIGLQIQRKYCKAVLCDFRLNIIENIEVRFQDINQKVLEDALVETVSALMKQGNILGIGIGSIGPLDIQNGVICNPPNFGNIEDFHIVDFMKDIFEVPVVLEHHYNCAVLAELYFGLGRNIGNFIYLGITKGVSMGGIVDGKLYSSFLHTVTEIGHVSIDYNGKPCRCGNKGCLEQYVSSDIIEEELQQLTGLDCIFREFCKMTDNEDVMNYFYQVMDYLKSVLVGCVNLFRPQQIIIGDEGKYFPDECIEYLEREVNRQILYKKWWYVQIRKTGVNKDLMLASSAMGIIGKVFDGELLFDE